MLRAVNAIVATNGADRGSHELKRLCEALRKAALTHIEHENALLGMILHEPATGGLAPEFLKVMSEAVVSEHIEEHRRWLGDLDSLIHRLCSSFDVQWQVLRLELCSWFVDHAVGYDAHLKAVFQAMENDTPDVYRRACGFPQKS